MKRVFLCLGLAFLSAVALSSSFRKDPPKPKAAGLSLPNPAPEPRLLQIPKAWDDAEVATLTLPLADAHVTFRSMTADYYYKLPERTIYKSYPLYAPGREPAGYIEWLKQQEPEVIFDPAKLKTQEDWIRVGELVFHAPASYNGLANLEKVHDRSWSENARVPVAADGTFPYFRYVIREKGKVDVADISCATCHTRVLPDGSVISGAQGNLPLEMLDSFSLRRRLSGLAAAEVSATTQQIRDFTRSRFAAPWIKPDPLQALDSMSLADIATAYSLIPPGVQARLDASLFYPVAVADLIGLRDRRYFDHTGRIRHRGIGDVMRYAILADGFTYVTSYGDYVPAGLEPDGTLPVTKSSRYSDAQLYALSLYLYSLEPPPSPYSFDQLAIRGKAVFDRSSCGNCHTPPLYTSNKLTEADGHTMAADHPERQNVIAFSVGTDPGLTLKTRRGTGFYKVPSLKGLWYRGPLEHNGSVATLEDWFDPRRLRDDYVPTGFPGYGVKTRAVKGHPYGLDLSAEDRKALIAFLRTL